MLGKKELETQKTYDWVFDHTKFSDGLWPITSSTEWELKEKCGLDKQDFKGKTVLDAGCGYGRIVEFIARAGAKKSVGIDLTPSALEQARGRTKDLDNIDLIFESIFDHKGKYDIVICKGVLMHTKDPKLALEKLCDMVGKGGTLSLWVYEYQNWLKRALTVGLRVFTVRMNKWWLWKLSCFMGHMARNRIIGKPFKAILRVDSDYGSVGNFDTFSMPYLAEFTFDQIEEWLKMNNFIITKKNILTENEGFVRKVNGQYGGGFGVLAKRVGL